jgi:rhodanese-related sulfurtransferase
MKSKIVFITGALIAAVFVLCSFTLTSCSTAVAGDQTKTAKEEIIVDVRTVEEWNNDGHADCTVNYPLDEIDKHAEELKAYKKVTLVCRSGNRANTAKSQLEKAGVKNIVNLGPWQNVVCK